MAGTIFLSFLIESSFSLLIRNILDQSQEEYISISSEIETLKLYIELEQIRFKEPFQYEINIDEELDIENTFIPTMLLQPHIENAIWHGFAPKETNCLLVLDFKKEGKNVLVVIRDNGVGLNSEHSKKEKTHESKAMSIIEQRLNSLGIKTGSDFSIDIVDLYNAETNKKGTEIRLIIPLINY